MIAVDEEWRPIAGFEGYYEVSSLGRVRSLDRIVPQRPGFTRFAKGVILSTPLSAGYPQVTLRAPGLVRYVKVHILVAEAFLGLRPDGHQVLHGNADKTDNRVANLRWGTPKENYLDAVACGGNFNVNKERCIRGHLLLEPNLCVHTLNIRGGRVCKACYNARAWARRQVAMNGAIIDESMIQDRSDSLYKNLVNPGPRLCIRGHELFNENRKRGVGACLACGRAHAKVRRLKEKGIEVDMQEIADEYYQLICAQYGK